MVEAPEPEMTAQLGSDKTSHLLAPEELPAANYVRNTVGALETKLALTSPPGSPRSVACLQQTSAAPIVKEQATPGSQTQHRYNKVTSTQSAENGLQHQLQSFPKRLRGVEGAATGAQLQKSISDISKEAFSLQPPKQGSAASTAAVAKASSAARSATDGTPATIFKATPSALQSPPTTAAAKAAAAAATQWRNSKGPSHGLRRWSSENRANKPRGRQHDIANGNSFISKSSTPRQQAQPPTTDLSAALAKASAWALTSKQSPLERRKARWNAHSPRNVEAPKPIANANVKPLEEKDPAYGQPKWSAANGVSPKSLPVAIDDAAKTAGSDMMNGESRENGLHDSSASEDSSAATSDRAVAADEVYAHELPSQQSLKPKPAVKTTLHSDTLPLSPSHDDNLEVPNGRVLRAPSIGEEVPELPVLDSEVHPQVASVALTQQLPALLMNGKTRGASNSSSTSDSGDSVSSKGEDVAQQPSTPAAAGSEGFPSSQDAGCTIAALDGCEAASDLHGGPDPEDKPQSADTAKQPVQQTEGQDYSGPDLQSEATSTSTVADNAATQTSDDITTCQSDQAHDEQPLAAQMALPNMDAANAQHFTQSQLPDAEAKPFLEVSDACQSASEQSSASDCRPTLAQKDMNSIPLPPPSPTIAGQQKRQFDMMEAAPQGENAIDLAAERSQLRSLRPSVPLDVGRLAAQLQVGQGATSISTWGGSPDVGTLLDASLAVQLRRAMTIDGRLHRTAQQLLANMGFRDDGLLQFDSECITSPVALELVEPGQSHAALSAQRLELLGGRAISEETWSSVQVVEPAVGYVSAPTSPHAHVIATAPTSKDDLSLPEPFGQEWSEESDDASPTSGVRRKLSFCQREEEARLKLARRRSESGARSRWALQLQLPQTEDAGCSPESEPSPVLTSPSQRLYTPRRSGSSRSSSRLSLRSSLRGSLRGANGGIAGALRLRYGTLSPRAFPDLDIAGAAHPPADVAPEAQLEALLNESPPHGEARSKSCPPSSMASEAMPKQAVRSEEDTAGDQSGNAIQNENGLTKEEEDPNATATDVTDMGEASAVAEAPSVSRSARHRQQRQAKRAGIAANIAAATALQRSDCDLQRRNSTGGSFSRKVHFAGDITTWPHDGAPRGDSWQDAAQDRQEQQSSPKDDPSGQRTDTDAAGNDDTSVARHEDTWALPPQATDAAAGSADGGDEPAAWPSDTPGRQSLDDEQWQEPSPAEQDARMQALNQKAAQLKAAQKKLDDQWRELHQHSAVVQPNRLSPGLYRAATLPGQALDDLCAMSPSATATRSLRSHPCRMSIDSFSTTSGESEEDAAESPPSPNNGAPHPSKKLSKQGQEVNATSGAAALSRQHPQATAKQKASKHVQDTGEVGKDGIGDDTEGAKSSPYRLKSVFRLPSRNGRGGSRHNSRASSRSSSRRGSSETVRSYVQRLLPSAMTPKLKGPRPNNVKDVSPANSPHVAMSTGNIAQSQPVNSHWDAAIADEAAHVTNQGGQSPVNPRAIWRSMMGKSPRL